MQPKPPLTDKSRRELYDEFWRWIETDVSAYSRQISSLLETLTDEQLIEFLDDRGIFDEDEDEDESEGEGD